LKFESLKNEFEKNLKEKEKKNFLSPLSLLFQLAQFPSSSLFSFFSPQTFPGQRPFSARAGSP
jgi:hypothetical protein